MRDIKFKAWNDGSWTYSEPMPDMGFWKWVAYDTNTVFCEYTGLKDKNGVEIYEGDIIRMFYTYSDKGTALNPSLVRFNNEYGGFEVVTPGKHGLDVPLNQFWITGNSFHRALDESTGDPTNILDRTEVIGNIYENPDELGELFAQLHPKEEVNE